MGVDRLDLIIIAVYLAGITAFGVRFRKRQHTLRDYFLADRNVPWWAISLSIVAAETSTLTIISIPGLAYRSNMTFKWRQNRWRIYGRRFGFDQATWVFASWG